MRCQNSPSGVARTEKIWSVFTFLQRSADRSYITVPVLAPVCRHATNFYFLTWTFTVIEWTPEENSAGFHWHTNSAPWTWVACELRVLPSISTTIDSIGTGEKARNLKKRKIWSRCVYLLFFLSLSFCYLPWKLVLYSALFLILFLPRRLSFSPFNTGSADTDWQFHRENTKHWGFQAVAS